MTSTRSRTPVVTQTATAFQSTKGSGEGPGHAATASITDVGGAAEASVTRTSTYPAQDTPSVSWPVRDETVTFRDVLLESGIRLDGVTVRYRLEGTLSPARDNLVLVVHALTGSVDASNWWRGVIGVGEIIDPRQHAVLCANLLGGCTGTTGPRTGDVNPFPAITTRDQAQLLARLLDALGVSQPLLVCGGSLGGMVTLEFAASFPARVRSAVALAAPAAQTAQGLAWNAIMRRAIGLGGATEGLALARMVGMLSYRTPESFERRFGRAQGSNDSYLVNEWLASHGERLTARFDAASYVALIDAMDAHDVGRGRGGVAAALAPVAQCLFGSGIPGDLLYPAEAVREWCSAVSATYVELPSIHGHDAFLLEPERVSAILAAALAAANDSASQTQWCGAHSVLGARGARGVLGAIAQAPRATPSRALPLSASPSPSRAPDHGASRRDLRPLRVAIAGCGNVGGALLDFLGERPVSASSVHVTSVLVRDAARPRPALAQAVARGLARHDVRTTDATTLLDADVDVLVEAIGGTTTARTLVETALKRGIRVVTANKALLAERGPALMALARTYGTTLEFEGAVAGAIPVVRCLRSGAAGVGITRLCGILNGTTNVVLERVANGESLADAVAHAQRAGYAEADPTRDLSGEDAEDKLRVLAWLAFGANPAVLRVVRRGVDTETAAWAAAVARDGDRVKLLASVERDGEALVARVVPTRVTADDPWALVSGPANRLVVESESAGALVFHGPGAGGRATAGALIGDLLGGT